MLTLPAQDIVEFDEFMDKVCKSNGMYASPFKMSTVMRELEDLSYWRQNRVCSGLIFSAPTTPSTQGPGAVMPTWRCNTTQGGFIINGTLAAFTLSDTYPPVGTDILQGDAVSGYPPILGVGESVILSVIGADMIIGGIHYPLIMTIRGAVAATPIVQSATEAELNAAFSVYGSCAGYIRIAKLTLNRTGNTTVTQTQDNTWRDA